MTRCFQALLRSLLGALLALSVLLWALEPVLDHAGASTLPAHEARVSPGKPPFETPEGKFEGEAGVLDRIEDERDPEREAWSEPGTRTRQVEISTLSSLCDAPWFVGMPFHGEHGPLAGAGSIRGPPPALADDMTV